jgi:hypothetical protein
MLGCDLRPMTELKVIPSPTEGRCIPQTGHSPDPERPQHRPMWEQQTYCRWRVFGWYNSQQTSQSACDRCDWLSFMKSIVRHSQDLGYYYCFATSLWQLCWQLPYLFLEMSLWLQRRGTHGWGHSLQCRKLGTLTESMVSNVNLTTGHPDWYMCIFIMLPATNFGIIA